MPSDHNGPELSEITKRIQKLERDNRCLKLAVGIALLAGGALLTMGQMPPRTYDHDFLRVKILDADKVVIHNDKGKPVAGLGSADDGTPLFFMTVSDDKNGFFVAAKDGLMSVNLFDPKSRSQVALKHDALAMRDEGGKNRAILSVGGHQAGLALYDEAEKGRLLLAVEDGGKALLGLSDPNGRLRWSLSGTDPRSR